MTHPMEKKAHDFAALAAKDEHLNKLIVETLQADETKVGSTINAMFDLLRIYGVDELIGAPKVGSEYVKGSNDPYDKIVTTLASGKTETKWFWNIVADDLPVGAAQCAILHGITEKEGDYAEMDDVAKEEARKTATRKRNLVRNAVKKAKRLFDRLGEINELKGVRVNFNWEDRPKKSNEPWTGKLANLLFPIVLQGMNEEGEVDRLKKFGADQIIGLDMAKIKKRMEDGKDAFQAIVMRERKDEQAQAANINLPELNMSVAGMDAENMVKWLAKKDTQTAIQKAIDSKDERYKATIVALDTLRMELANIPRLAKRAKEINDADRDTEESEAA